LNSMSFARDRARPGKPSSISGLPSSTEGVDGSRRTHPFSRQPTTLIGFVLTRDLPSRGRGVILAVDRPSALAGVQVRRIGARSPHLGGTMRKTLAMVVALGMVLAAGTALAEGKKEAPKQLVFEAKQGAVTFDHAKHAEAAKNDCTACHDKLFPQEKAPLGYKEGCTRKRRPRRLPVRRAMSRAARHSRARATARSATSRSSPSGRASRPDAPPPGRPAGVRQRGRGHSSFSSNSPVCCGAMRRSSGGEFEENEDVPVRQPTRHFPVVHLVPAGGSDHRSPVGRQFFALWQSATH